MTAITELKTQKSCIHVTKEYMSLRLYLDVLVIKSDT